MKPGFSLILCLLISLLFSGCAGRSEFKKGYEQGAADTVKRQYWIEQNLQKDQKNQPDRNLTLYQIPVQPDPNDPVKKVPYEIALPIRN